MNRTWQGEARARRRRRAVGLWAVLIAGMWSRAAASQSAVPREPESGGMNGLTVGGIAAISCSTIPLITTALMVSEDGSRPPNAGDDTDRDAPGEVVAMFLVPGATTFAAGVAMLVAGVAQQRQRAPENTARAAGPHARLVLGPTGASVVGRF